MGAPVLELRLAETDPPPAALDDAQPMSAAAAAAAASLLCSLNAGGARLCGNPVLSLTLMRKKRIKRAEKREENETRKMREKLRRPFFSIEREKSERERK